MTLKNWIFFLACIFSLGHQTFSVPEDETTRSTPSLIIPIQSDQPEIPFNPEDLPPLGLTPAQKGCLGLFCCGPCVCGAHVLLQAINKASCGGLFYCFPFLNLKRRY